MNDNDVARRISKAYNFPPSDDIITPMISECPECGKPMAVGLSMVTKGLVYRQPCDHSPVKPAPESTK